MRFGVYEEVEELGRGGMGVVLIGRSPEGRKVAIKVLLRPGAEGALQRFEREGRLLAALGEAEGFVPLLDAGRSPRGPYIVMPFVGGGTLRDRMKKGPFPVEEALRHGCALARAVAAAHGRGIIHRDLKPENILFTEDGRPLIADLGLAKHFSRDTPGGSASVDLSRPGDLRGTIGYMAPEQARDASAAGPPANVFSLGAILYELLAGHPAFGADSPIETLGRVENGRFEPLARARPEAPPWLAGAVDRCLDPRPDRRFADAAALERALEAPTRTRPIAGLIAVAVIPVVLATVAVARSRGTAPSIHPSPPSPRLPSPPPPRPPPAPPPFPARYQPCATSKLTRLVAAIGGGDLRHGGALGAVASSPDGTQIVAGGWDERVILWDVATHQEIATLAQVETGVSALAFSPSGKQVAVGSGGGKVLLLDTERREPPRLLGAHKAPVSAVVFFPDGRRLVSAAYDHVLNLFDLEGGETGTISGRGRFTAAAVLPDGRVLASGTDRSFQIFDFTTGLIELRVPVHTQAVNALTLTADGRFGLTSSGDAVRFWDRRDPKDERLLRTIAHQAEPSPIALSRDAKRALTVGPDNAARLWDLETGRELHVFGPHLRTIRAVAFTASETRAVTASDDGTLGLWDLATGADLAPHTGHRGKVASIKLLANGTALSSGRDGTLRVWDIERRVELACLPGHAGVVQLDVTPDGQRAITWCVDGSVRLWDMEARTNRILESNVDRVAEGAALSPDGKQALVGRSDGTLALWELDPPRKVFDWPVLEASHIRAVAFSPDGKRALIGEATNVSLWNMARSKSRGFPVGKTDQAAAVAFSADGKRGYSASSDGKLRVWELDALPEPYPKDGADVGGPAAAAYTALVLARSGRLGVAANHDGTIRLLDLDSTVEVDRIDLGPAGDRPTSLALAPDGRTLLVGTARGLILRFEVRLP